MAVVIMPHSFIHSWLLDPIPKHNETERTGHITISIPPPTAGEGSKGVAGSKTNLENISKQKHGGSTTKLVADKTKMEKYRLGKPYLWFPLAFFWFYQRGRSGSDPRARQSIDHRLSSSSQRLGHLLFEHGLHAKHQHNDVSRQYKRCDGCRHGRNQQ